MVVITSVKWEVPPGSFIKIRQLGGPGDVRSVAQVGCYLDCRLAVTWILDLTAFWPGSQH